MNCPECGGQTSVIESRPAKNNIKRRRECRECGYRFTTFEVRREHARALKDAMEIMHAIQMLRDPPSWTGETTRDIFGDRVLDYKEE